MNEIEKAATRDAANDKILKKYGVGVCPFCDASPEVTLEFKGLFIDYTRPAIRCINHTCKIRPYCMGYNQETIQDLTEWWNNEKTNTKDLAYERNENL
jgi:hypothetical protein